MPGVPDLTLFPTTAWLAAARRALGAAPAAALGYTDLADGLSCAGAGRRNWRGSAAYGPRPTRSWSAPASPRPWPC